MNQAIDILNKAELELKESNKRNQIFIEQAPHAIAMFDKEMCYLAASRKWVIDYKLEGKEIVGLSHYDIFPEIGDDWKAIHQACLQGEINQCDEAPFERADGSFQWITWDVRPWYISESNIGGLIMYTADITHLKEKDAERKKIEEILDKTNEIARIGTWEVDLINNTINWSRITKEIHEVLPDFHPNLETAINFFKEGTSRDMIQLAVSEAIERGTTYDLELELVTAKGNIVWARAIGQAEFKNGRCIRLYGVFQNIDEIKRSKEALGILNEKLNTIINSGYVSIIGTDVSGLITSFSKGSEMLLQYTAEEVIGIHTPGLIHLEEEVEKRGKELSVLFGTPIKGFEVFTKLKEGGFESREWTYVRKDGSTFPVQLVVSAIRNSQRDIIGFLGIATDISEIKKAEKEMKALLQITTDQKERLKNFAHIVSHNLRSHSTNIYNLVELFTELNPNFKEDELVSMLTNAATTLKSTIENLNEVVSINTSSTQQLVIVDLRKSIDSALSNLSLLITEHNVSIRNFVDSSLFVTGVPAYIDSIILNFLSNAIKYRSPLRIPFIELKAIKSDGFVNFIISDNGLGIDLKRYGDKLFGMYKTFHKHPDSRGVGLFITKNQLEAIGGTVEVKSQVDIGTTFIIKLKADES